MCVQVFVYTLLYRSWTCYVLCLVAQVCPVLWDPMGCSPPDSLHGDSLGKSIGVGCPPPGYLPNPEIKARSSYCRWILYCMSHQGSPRILQWVAIPFPGELPDPGIEPRSPALAGGFFTSWATRKAWITKEFCSTWTYTSSFSIKSKIVAGTLLNLLFTHINFFLFIYLKVVKIIKVQDVKLIFKGLETIRVL